MEPSNMSNDKNQKLPLKAVNKKRKSVRKKI